MIQIPVEEASDFACSATHDLLRMELSSAMLDACWGWVELYLDAGS
jgi:hypothetical protein